MNKKNVKFTDLVLLSEISKSGFSCSFDENLTVITGPIDTGKSSIVKHIYFSLGCNVIIDKAWGAESPCSLLKCTIDQEEYAFLRRGKLRAIFKSNADSDYQLIAKGFSASSITPTIHKIFDFNLELTLKQTKELALAEPSVLFAPYYIDQDTGWIEALSSFSYMQMYDKWKASAIDFHSGIKPKEFYLLGAKVREKTQQIEELKLELKALTKAFNRFKLDSKEGLFNIDMEAFEETLAELLKKCEELNNIQFDHRVKLSSLMEQRLQLVNEKVSVQDVIEKLTDITFISDIDAADSYLNKNRKSSLLDSKNDLSQLIYEADNQIEKQKQVISDNIYKSDEIKELIKQKHNEITFSDVIKSESKKDVKKRFDVEIEKVNNEIKELLLVVDTLKQEQKSYTDLKRTKNINKTFKDYAYNVLNKLHVNASDLGGVGQHKKVTDSATGSRKPRSLFAYHYSLLKTIHKFTDTPNIPIVIDSPKQQELDVEGVKPLLEICSSELAPYSQMIISSVEFKKEDYDGFENAKVIRLSNKCKLLDTKSYSNALEVLEPLLEML
jgi:hypothetical protein